MLKLKLKPKFVNSLVYGFVTSFVNIHIMYFFNSFQNNVDILPGKNTVALKHSCLNNGDIS